MKVYLAAPFSWKLEIKKYSDVLVSTGVETTSSWVDEPVSPDWNLNDHDEWYNLEHAVKDVRDIERADILAVFTVDPAGTPKPRGSRHWETGYAHALGKEIVVIGPRENLFHFLPTVKQFNTKEEATVYLHKRNLN